MAGRHRTAVGVGWIERGKTGLCLASSSLALRRSCSECDVPRQMFGGGTLTGGAAIAEQSRLMSVAYFFCPNLRLRRQHLAFGCSFNSKPAGILYCGRRTSVNGHVRVFGQIAATSGNFTSS
jgi:hypothetical protein